MTHSQLQSYSYEGLVDEPASAFLRFCDHRLALLAVAALIEPLV